MSISQKAEDYGVAPGAIQKVRETDNTLEMEDVAAALESGEIVDEDLESDYLVIEAEVAFYTLRLKVNPFDDPQPQIWKVEIA